MNTPRRRNLAGLDAHPVVRNYQFVGLAALLVVFAVLAMRGDLVVALLPVLVAFLGLFFNAPGLPIVFLFVTVYMLVCPYGLPFGLTPVTDIPDSAFRVSDLVLSAAAGVYFACQFRVLSLTARAMPQDNPFADKKAPPILRPTGAVESSEVEGMFATMAGIVVAAQIIWLTVTMLRVDLTAFPPFHIEPEVPFLTRNATLADMPRWVGRALILSGMVLATGFVTGFVFWYWRLTRLTAEEGSAILLDTGWSEARRELSRREVWLAWALRRLEAVPGPPRPPRGLFGWVLFIGWVTGATLWGMAAVAWYTSSWGFCTLLVLLGFAMILFLSRRVLTNAPPPPPDPDAPKRTILRPLVQVSVVFAWVMGILAWGVYSGMLRRNPLPVIIVSIVGLIAIWFVFRQKPQEPTL